MAIKQTLSREVVGWSEHFWADFGPAWAQVLDATADPSAFLSVPWLRSWLEIFGEVVSPVGVIWRVDDRPVGCAVISRSTGKIGPFPVSRSCLNVAGHTGVGCEHNDVLAVAPHRTAVLADLVSFLSERGHDEFSVDGVREAFFDELRELWPSSTWNGHRSESPFVSLSDIRSSNQPYLHSLSSNTRSQIRRSNRLYADRFGEGSVAIASSVHEAEDWLAELVELHTATWHARGMTGAFEGITRTFHSRLLDLAFSNPEDGLDVHIVRVAFGDTTVGLLYNLIVRGRIQFYQSGFRYDDDRKLKPGLTSHSMAIEHYLTGDYQEYDFLGGEAQSVRYKTSLANASRTLVWAQLPAATIKMRVFERLRRGRRSLRSRTRST